MKLALSLAMLASALTAPGEVLDRIAVTVGKEVIAESALVLELRVTAFLDRRPVDLSLEAKRKAADRLVEQVLILQEARDSHFNLPTLDDAEVLADQVKSQYPTKDEFNAELERHDITERDLAAHLLAGLRTLAFTDLRFRPGIQVSEEDVKAYYDKLVAEAPSTGAPPFEQSRDGIEKLLVDQRVLDALDTWLEMARTSVRVEYREKVFR